MILMVEKTM